MEAKLTQKELIAQLEDALKNNTSGMVGVFIKDVPTIIQSLQSNEWVRVEDLEELPTKEVLAINKQEYCLVGYLSKSENQFECNDDQQLLPNVTHIKYLTPPNK